MKSYPQFHFKNYTILEAMQNINLARMKIRPAKKINFSHKFCGFVSPSPYFIYSINIENTAFNARFKSDLKLFPFWAMLFHHSRYPIFADFQHSPLDIQFPKMFFFPDRLILQYPCETFSFRISTWKVSFFITMMSWISEGGYFFPTPVIQDFVVRG